MTRIRIAQSLETLHRGGLTGAVRAEQAEDLTLGYFKGNVIHGYGLAIGLAEVLYFYDGRH